MDDAGIDARLTARQPGRGDRPERRPTLITNEEWNPMLCVSRKETEQITFGKAGDVLEQPMVIEIAAIHRTSVEVRCDAQSIIRIERTRNVADCRADRTREIERGND